MYLTSLCLYNIVITYIYIVFTDFFGVYFAGLDCGVSLNMRGVCIHFLTERETQGNNTLKA